MEISNIPGVYEIVNASNNKRYVGSSANLQRRCNDHFSALRGNRHVNIILQNAFNKYGEDAFSFKPILLCDVDSLLFYEQACIDGLAPEYNIAVYADAPTRGRHASEETRKKISEARHNISEETRKKISNAGRRRVQTEETRKKISETKIGKSNGRLGTHHSEETKRKIGEANSGEKNYGFGKYLSEETKRKMSEAHRESLKNIPSGMLGKHHTEETKKLLSEKLKAYYQSQRELNNGGTE